MIRRVACVGFAERKRVVRYVVRVTTSRAAPESKQEIRFDSLMIEITVYHEIHVVSLLHLKIRFGVLSTIPRLN